MPSHKPQAGTRPNDPSSSSPATNESLHLSFAPSPDYAGIAKAAAGGNLWAGKAGTRAELDELLPRASEAVKKEGGVGAVLDAHLEGPHPGPGVSALVG